MQAVSKHIFFGVLVLLSFKLSAQQYFVQHVSQTEGLPQNSINKLAFTKNGFLWLATEDGLVRFDGVNVNVFSMYNQPAIKNDRFKTIIKDVADRIYAGNADGQFFYLRENIPVLQDTLPRLYHLHGLYPVRNNFAQALHKSNPFKLAPIPMHVLALGSRLMVAAKFKSIALFVDNQIVDTLPFLHQQIAAFFTWNNKPYVFTKSGTIYHLHITSANKLQLMWVKQFPSTDATPYKVFYKHDKQVFVAHRNHIYKLELTDNNALLKPVYMNFNEHEIITDIDVEAERKIIAVGTLTNGIYLLRPSYFEHLRNSIQFHHHVVDPHFAFSLLNDSTIVTANKQILVNGQANRFIPSQEAFSQEVIATKNNQVLLTRGNTIYAYSTKTAQVKPFFKTVSGDISVMKYVGDTLFVADATHWYVLHQQHVLATVKHSAQAGFRRIHDVAFADGKCVMATSKGLIVYDIKSKQARTYQPQLDIRSVLQHEDAFMLSTYGQGVWVFKQRKFTALNLDALGLISKAHAILADSLHRFWVSTNHGLFVIHYRDVLKRIKDTTFTINYIKYDKQNGLLSAEFNGGRNPSALSDEAGNFYFSNMSGIVKFNPYVLSKVYKNVPVYADKIWVNELPVRADLTRIDVERMEDKDMLQIHLATPYWKNRDNEVLFFKVMGPLSYTGRINLSRPTINISYLPAGKYRIVVTKSNSFNEQVQYVEFALNVKKEFHETAWFWVVVVTGVALLLILAVYVYNWSLLKQKRDLEAIVAKRTSDLELSNQLLVASESQLRQTVKVKSKLVSIISHDIVTPLKFMSMVTQNTNEQNHTEVSGLLQDVQVTTGRLYQNAQNILNWIKYQDGRIMPHQEAVSPFALVQDAADVLAHAFQLNDNQFSNDIDADVIIKTDKTILTIIVQNLLANAAKYVKHAQVKATYSCEQHKHQLCIIDTGSGISETALQRINQVLKEPILPGEFTKYTDSSSTGLGYIIISELSKLIDLQVTVESHADTGTKVLLSWHD